MEQRSSQTAKGSTDWYCTVRIWCYRLKLYVVIGEGDMDPWWWVPIGLATWFVVALAAGLVIGPVLRHSSRAREELEEHTKQMPDERGPPCDERQAS